MSEALTAPDFSTIPVGPLALIALPGCEELAAKIDAYLKTWREIRESEHKTTIAFSGYQRDSYLIKAAFPRFGSGESKCHIQQSVRGYDIFIVCDMFNYGLTYKMYGKDNDEPRRSLREPQARHQRDRRQGKTHHRYHAHALRRKTAQAFKQRIP